MAYFNYRNLDPTEFEALAKDVMERLLGRRLFRYGQGKDGGIDLCDDIREKHIVVQCKRYHQGTFDNLYSILKREEKPKIDMLDPRPERYYVFTSLDLLPQQKQKILDLFQGYMEGESSIVDGIAINDFFRDEQNHDLISRNIKLFLSFPENYQYSPTDLSQIESNRLFDRLFDIFENDRKNHPSIRMMDPDPLLFPKGLPEILSDGRLATEEAEAPRAIRAMIIDSWKREDKKHILLIGGGGIGKTVAMLTLPEEGWFKKLGIPVIYIPLQRLDTYEGDLNRYIKEKIGSNNYERCIELANRTFNEHPDLLLLLDGFNEIPDNYKQKAEKYIREWMEKPGIQIITTSRLGFFLENRFLKYRLQPLPYDTVRTFLVTAGIAEEQLPGQNDRLWDVINVPLMLAMYTQIEKVIEIAKRSSASSILEWKEPDNSAHIIWNYLQMELYRCIEKEDSSYSAMQYAVAILVIAPYVCGQMSRQNKFYIKREDFQELIKEALNFYTIHQDLLDRQILKLRRKYDPYNNEDLFQKNIMEKYTRILIDNTALFQEQEIYKKGCKDEEDIDYSYSLMHQNFRDTLAAFFICSCISRTSDTKEKGILLDLVDHYVKEYMAEHLSDPELMSIWDRHRKEDPEDGKITFILMDLIGRQRNYDYRELDFSNLDLTKTNLHRLLSKRLDICPLPRNRNKFRSTKIDFDCFAPNGHTDGINSAVFSPDGRQLASGASDSTIRIWNLASGECRVLDEGHTESINSVVFSPDGRRLASGSNDSKVRIWDLESGQCHVLDGHSNSVRSVTFSPDGRQLASASDDKTVRIWTLENEECRVLVAQSDRISSVAFSPDGRWLASGSNDSKVRIWDLESGQCRILDGHSPWVSSVAFSPDGRQLASASSSQAVLIWDLETGECRILHGHSDSVTSVAFSSNGRLLACGVYNGTVSIWDLETGECRILHGHSSSVRSVAFNPDGRQLASGAADRTLRVWDLETGGYRVLDGHSDMVNSLAFCPDGRKIAGGAADRTIRIWDLESREYHVLEGHSSGVSSIAFSPNGRLLACCVYDGTVSIWDLESSECRVLNGHSGGHSIDFSPDGQQLASDADDYRTVRIWDLETGECRVFDGTSTMVNRVSFSPDGILLACSTYDSSKIRIWDLETGECHLLDSHSYWVSSVTFSPDGRLLACGVDDRTIRIWDLETGKCYVLKGHTDHVYRVTFSTNGSQLASGSYDKTVRIWDFERGECRVLEGHTSRVKSVTFSPDGRLLASGSDDGTVRIWNLEKFREVDKYVIITHINLSGANFELSVIDEKDKEVLRAAGARV